MTQSEIANVAISLHNKNKQQEVFDLLFKLLYNQAKDSPRWAETLFEEIKQLDK